MPRYQRVLSCLGVAAGVLMLPGHAGATTIETFGFGQGGWVNADTNMPDSQGLLQGTFTGVVDPLTGMIPLANLTSFTIEYHGSITADAQQVLVNLQSFSFNAALFDANPASAGAQMQIVTQRHDAIDGLVTECVGAPAALWPQCSGNFPLSVRGVLTSDFDSFFSTQNAVVRLLSRTVIRDPDPSPVPEPGTLILLGTGVMSLIARFRQRAEYVAFGRALEATGREIARRRSLHIARSHHLVSDSPGPKLWIASVTGVWLAFTNE